MKRDDWGSSAYQKILETGAEWADKKTAFNYLDKCRHSVLAELKNKYIHLKSDAAKETEARASKEYKDFLKKLSEAESEFNHAEVQYYAAKTLASLRQTQESLKKAELAAQNQMT